MAVVIFISCFSTVKVPFLLLFVSLYASKLILAEENAPKICLGNSTSEEIESKCSCDVKPCLVICPPQNATGVNESRSTENEDSENFDGIPDVYLTNLTVDPEGTKPLEERFQIVQWYPCKDGEAYFLDPEEYASDRYYLLGNGSLLLPELERDMQLINFGNYCFRRIEDSSNYTPEVCALQQEFEAPPDRTANYVGALISVPFLIATIIVYSILTELKNLYGATLRCYLYCLVLMYVSVVTDGIKPMDYSAGAFCLFVGYTIYFSFLASSFWLNVMCFDMWRRFGGSEVIRGTNNHRFRNRFRLYSIYAWGCPSVMTAICIGMEFTPEMPEWIIRPGFLENACWFARYSGGLYFYGPMGVTIACNVCFFLATSIKMIQHNRQTRLQLTSADSQRHDDKRIWFGLYLKLFVVMGITWSTEVISSAYENLQYIWYVTDMINALQGLLIFVIFVCKKRIWISLKKWFTRVQVTRKGCVFVSSKSTSKSGSTNDSFAGPSSNPDGDDSLALKQIKKSSI